MQTGQRSAGLGQFGWASFQWARDCGGSVLIVYVFAPYFASQVVGDAVRGQVLWGHISAIAGVCTGLASPFLGAMVDATGRRKTWLCVMVVMMAAASVLLWWSLPGGRGLGVFWTSVSVVGFLIAYNFSDVVHSSMLPSLVASARLGRLSGLGIALAQASTVIGMGILLYAFLLPGQGRGPFIPASPLLGIGAAHAMNVRVSGPFSAVWLVLFSLPLFLFTPDIARAEGRSLLAVARSSFLRTCSTIANLRRFPNVALFLLARTLFVDAQVTLLVFSSIYAQSVFHWSPMALTAYGILLCLASAAGALLAGFAADRYGPKRATLVGICGAAVGLLAEISITGRSILLFHVPGAIPQLVFIPLGAVTCTFVIGVFGTSRTIMARIAPIGQMAEFFGLYGLCGTLTAFVGPELVAAATALTHSQRGGMAALLVLFAAGIVGLAFVREQRAVG